MIKKRAPIPSRTQKLIFQEAGSQCAFCPQSEVSTLEIHHIDDDPSHNDPDNLVLVCASCHAKITANAISFVDVVTKKRELFLRTRRQASGSSPAVSVSISRSNFRGDIAQNIVKISSPKAPRITHPPGSLGADLEKKGYIDYLIRRYYEFRARDSSYGRKSRFSHAVIHSNIEREFGFKTFFMPVTMFEELSAYLKGLIDRTIQGKRNSAKDVANYHSYDEHFASTPDKHV